MEKKKKSPSWVLYLSKICAAGLLNLCDNDMTLICTIHLLVKQGSLETGYTCLDFSDLYYKFNYRMLKITLHKKYFKGIIWMLQRLWNAKFGYKIFEQRYKKENTFQKMHIY